MEYALLDKPILFYCYDYDTYDRDFYLDYDNDLPGRIVRSQEEFVSALNDEETYIVSDKMRGFIRRYMGACDGHSAERISAYIRELLDA
jgi:CDP-glycerol glycerophosphotransferase (TagB/SpsB family)